MESPRSLPNPVMFEDCKQYLSYEGNKRNIKTWTDLSNFKGYPEEIITHKYILAFSEYIYNSFRRSSLFTDRKVTSTTYDL